MRPTSLHSTCTGASRHPASDRPAWGSDPEPTPRGAVTAGWPHGSLRRLGEGFPRRVLTPGAGPPSCPVPLLQANEAAERHRARVRPPSACRPSPAACAGYPPGRARPSSHPASAPAAGSSPPPTPGGRHGLPRPGAPGGRPSPHPAPAPAPPPRRLTLMNSACCCQSGTRPYSTQHPAPTPGTAHPWEDPPESRLQSPFPHKVSVTGST